MALQKFDSKERLLKRQIAQMNSIEIEIIDIKIAEYPSVNYISFLFCAKCFLIRFFWIYIVYSVCQYSITYHYKQRISPILQILQHHVYHNTTKTLMTTNTIGHSYV